MRYTNRRLLYFICCHLVNVSEYTDGTDRRTDGRTDARVPDCNITLTARRGQRNNTWLLFKCSTSSIVTLIQVLTHQSPSRTSLLTLSLPTLNRPAPKTLLIVCLLQDFGQPSPTRTWTGHSMLIDYAFRCGLLRQMWSMYLSLCWSHWCTVQKWLNRSRCRLRADSSGPKEPCAIWGLDPSTGRDNFRVLPGPFEKHWESSPCCGVCSKKII